MFKNKMSTMTSNLIYNRFVLYILVFIAVVNVISNALVGDYMIPTLFFLIGFIISFFNKNMVVILAIAIAVSNIMKFGTRVRLNEGLENPDKALDDFLVDKETKEETKEEAKINGAAVLKKRQDDIDPIPAPERTTMDPKSIIEAKKHIKELTKLHTTITQNMDTMENSLKNANELFTNLKEGLRMRNQSRI